VPDYWYSALSASGEVQEGWMKAPTEAEVESWVRDRGGFLIKAEQREKPVKKLTDGKVNRTELLAFLDYVAGSFDVGIPILTTLDDIPNRVESKRLKIIIGEIRYAMSEEGKSLSQALSEHPKAFPALYVGTIQAGEASGELGYALHQLVEYMDWQEGISSQMKQALMYPAVVLSAVAILVVGLIAFVFPKLMPILQGGAFKVTPPLPTRIIVGTATWVKANYVSTMVIIVSLVVGISAARASERGRLIFDRLILKVPVFGTVIRDVNMARFITYLGLFYRTGVELMHSLSIVEKIIQNRVVSDSIRGAREMIGEGVSMAAAFGSYPVFPNVVIRSLALGEATGDLDAALVRAKTYYGREIPALVRRVITLLQPMLIVVLGGVILLVALAIVLPILNIYNQIGIRR
jgi:type IV pilus assembly protein PilC